MKKRNLSRILVLLLVAVFLVGCGAQSFDPTELNNKVAELEEAKNELEAQIGSLIATNEELRAANQQLAESVRNLTNDAPSAKNIENLQNAQEALITQVAGLENDLQNALNDIASQKETIASQGRTIADQKKTIADQESLTEERNAVLLALTEKVAELDSLKGQMSTMQESISSATTALQELRTQYNDALSKYGALDSRTKALEDRVTALETQITGFQNQLTEAASTIADHTKTIADLSQKAADLAKLQEDFSKQAEELDELGKTVDEQGKTIDEQGKTIDEQGKTIEEQAQTIADQEAALKALDEKQAELEALQEQVGTLEESLATALETLGTTGTTAEEAIAAIADVQEQLQDLYQRIYTNLYPQFLNPYGYASFAMKDFSDVPVTVVNNEIEFLDALLASYGSSSKYTSPSAIKITRDLNLGWKEVNSMLTEAGKKASTYSNVYGDYNSSRAKEHPTLVESGVARVFIRYTNGLMIYSDNGSAIKHCGIQFRDCNNVALRNLSFEELWEWDESSRGMYNTNDWDLINATNGNVNGIWIDHCSFQCSYDGLFDMGGTTSGKATRNVTISWCDLNFRKNDFILDQIKSLDQRLIDSGAWTEETLYTLTEAPVYKPDGVTPLNDGYNGTLSYPEYWAEIRAMINRTRGTESEVTEEQVIEFFSSGKKLCNLGNSGSQSNYNYASCSITVHHVLAGNIQERFLRLRKMDAHMYNVYNDGTPLYHLLKSEFHFENMSIAPTENSAVFLENSYYINVDDPIRANQNNGQDDRYTGRYYVKNSRYITDDFLGNPINYLGDSGVEGSPWATSANRYDEREFFLRLDQEIPYSYKEYMVEPDELYDTLVGNVGAGVLNNFNWLYIDEDAGNNGISFTPNANNSNTTYQYANGQPMSYKIDTAPDVSKTGGPSRLQIADVTIAMGSTFTPANPAIYNFYNNSTSRDGNKSNVLFVKDVDYTLDVDLGGLDTNVPGKYSVTYTFTDLHRDDDVVVRVQNVIVYDPADAVEFSSYSVSREIDQCVHLTYTMFSPEGGSAAGATIYYLASDNDTETEESIRANGSFFTAASASGTENWLATGGKKNIFFFAEKNGEAGGIVKQAIIAEKVVEIRTPADFMKIFKMASTVGYRFEIMNDIDFGGYARVSEVSALKQATIDGNGHKISNLDTTCFGLFRSIDGSVIRNITFDKIYIDCGNDSAGGVMAQNVAGTSAFIDVTFIDCGTRNYRANGAGIIAGNAEAGYILNLTNVKVIDNGLANHAGFSGDVNGQSVSGGLIGTAGNGKLYIKNLYIKGLEVVAATYEKLAATSGILIGTASGTVDIDGLVIEKANVLGSTNVGGLIGSTSATVTVKNAYIDVSFNRGSYYSTNQTASSTGIFSGSSAATRYTLDNVYYKVGESTVNPGSAIPANAKAIGDAATDNAWWNANLADLAASAWWIASGAIPAE